MKTRNFCLLILAFLVWPVMASAGIPHGYYVTQGGWGVLFISGGVGHPENFKIDTIGANGHSCGLEGTIDPKTGKGVLPDTNDEPPCKVDLKLKDGSIEVSGESSETNDCSGYCGMRASFGGEYFKVSRQCEPYETSSLINEYETSNRADELGIVKDKIEPVLANCSKTLKYQEATRLRKVIALAKYHAGDKAGCRQALETDKEIITATEEDNAEYPPADADNARALTKEMRDVWELCRPE